MSKILRAVQKIFAGSLSAPSNISQFGSLKAGAANYSLDPKVIQALSNYLQGWNGATVGNSSPPMQDRNALDYLFSRQIAYLMQAGLAEWDADTTYFTDSFCSNAGVVYISKTDNNTGNLVTDTNNWKTLASTIAPSFNTSALAKGWINFSGQGGLFVSSAFNINSVTRLGTGNYLLSFPAFPDASYLPMYCCAQENGIQATIMATRFPGDNKTPTTLQVRTVSNFDSSGFDSPEISVQLFSL